MKLITEETWDVDKVLITEGNDTEKTCFLEGTYMQADIQNRNSRMYPRPVLKSQVHNYNEVYIQKNRALGEYGHPDKPTVQEGMESHVITELRFINENDVYGKARILRHMPRGALVYNLVVKEGIQVGMSSRGLGTVKPSHKGIGIVQNDFRLTTVDVVLDPSAPGAFVDGIMEGREWILEDGVLVEREVETIKAKVDEAARKRRTQDEVVKIFEQILQNKGYLNS